MPQPTPAERLQRTHWPRGMGGVASCIEATIEADAHVEVG